MVEHCTTNPEIEGSNLATVFHEEEKMVQRENWCGVNTQKRL